MLRKRFGFLAVVLLVGGCTCASKSAGKETPVNTIVHREGDRVRLDGVKGWFCGDKESSIHAAQEAVMNAVGENIKYEYLVGVSGLAFRTQVSKEGFCPSSPHSYCGYRCVERAMKALPWNTRVFQVKAEDAEKVKGARRAAVESIDRGAPVEYGFEEDGVIVGHQKNGEEWICLHPYKDRGAKTFVETKWPWWIVVFTERKKEMPSKRDLAIEALQQAVKMAKTPESGAYFLGFRAWEGYIQKLKALEQADEKTRKDAMQGNAWIYECLAQYRGAASWYLRDVAGEFNAPAAEHLRRAADLYGKMSDEVLRDKEHCVVTIAPYPWALKDGKVWTTEMRKKQIRRLEAALPLEREALQEIEKALALAGSPTPTP
ncbi:MAG: hypothetical protein AB1696_28140 [Planctomycetota bacterium]